MTLHENRPCAGIGVVEVQKLEVFCDFAWARATLQKLEVFCDFVLARATLCGDRRGQGAKTRGFLRFCFGSRDPLRGSAWSRCKNSRFFAISAVLATLCGDRHGRGTKTRGFLRFLRCSRPSAGIGVVKADLLTFWFSNFGPYLVMVPKG